VSVTQAHQSLSGWSLPLHTGGATDDFIARLSPFDHIFIVPRGVGPQPSLSSLREVAIFSGRIDGVEMDGGSTVLSGPSLAVWMGDESGRGAYPTSGVSQTIRTLTGPLGTGWLASIFARAGSNLNGLYLGRYQNLQSGVFGWQIERFATVRQNLDELAGLMDRPYEWIVKPNGEIQLEGWVGNGLAGFGPTSTGVTEPIDYRRTLFDFFPRVLFGEGEATAGGSSSWTQPQTVSVPLQVVPASVAVSWDFSNHVARGIAIGNGAPPDVKSTGTNKNLRGTNGFGLGGERIGWDTVVNFETNAPGELQAAANSVGRLASIRRSWTVSALSTDVVGTLKPGDYVWIHSPSLPGLASLTYGNEAEDWAGINDVSDPITARVPQAANVAVGGRNIYPARARVESMDWPVTDRFDVYHVATWNGTEDVTLLNSMVDFEPDGPVSVDCNGAKPRWQLQQKALGITFARSFDLSANSRRAR